MYAETKPRFTRVQANPAPDDAAGGVEAPDGLGARRRDPLDGLGGIDVPGAPDPVDGLDVALDRAGPQPAIAMTANATEPRPRSAMKVRRVMNRVASSPRD